MGAVLLRLRRCSWLSLRNANGLTLDRARSWVRALACVSLMGIAAALWQSPGGLTPQGRPLGTDFISFYTAGLLSAGGHDAYNMMAHAAAQSALFPSAHYGYTTFLYPPPFLLICRWFAGLAYLPALLCWLGAGLVLLLVAMRPLVVQFGQHAVGGHAVGWLALVASPAVLVNAGSGQNGMLTAACFAGYMALADRWPVLAGACLGALVIKPQLALAVPVVLLCAGRGRAIAGGAIVALGLCALSVLVLGRSAWDGFFAAAPGGGPMLIGGLNGFAKMISPFAGISLLGGGPLLAATGQGVLAMVVLALLGYAARRGLSGAAEGGLMAAAAVLISPWSFDYDLVLLVPALGWLCGQAIGGFRPWEKTVLLLAYSLPLWVRLLASTAGVPLGPVVIAALFVVLWCRATDRRAGAAPLDRVNNRTSCMWRDTSWN